MRDFRHQTRYGEFARRLFHEEMLQPVLQRSSVQPGTDSALTRNPYRRIEADRGRTRPVGKDCCRVAATTPRVSWDTQAKQ